MKHIDLFFIMHLIHSGFHPNISHKCRSNIYYYVHNYNLHNHIYLLYLHKMYNKN